MCIAVLLALALVLANEKWPDGYRTAPQLGVETTPVGAVVKGAVTLPEQEAIATEKSKNTDKVNTENMTATSQEGSQSAGQKGPQGELVAIDSGTLRNDVSAVDSDATTSQTDAAKQESKAKQEAESKTAQAEASKESKPVTDNKARQKENKPAAENKTAQKESKPEKESKTTQASTSAMGKATPKILVYTKEAVLEIKASGPIRCKTFRLSSPERLVVDLIGKWDVPIPTVPSNTIIQRVRVGDASERTRIVLDLKRALQADKIVQVNDTTINIRMQ